MTRQEANLKIADIIKSRGYPIIGEYLEKLAKDLPNQRAGQIICNYIYPDYQINSEPFMEDIFPINFDPFFEESTETLKRLCSENS